MQSATPKNGVSISKRRKVYVDRDTAKRETNAASMKFDRRSHVRKQPKASVGAPRRKPCNHETGEIQAARRKNAKRALAVDSGSAVAGRTFLQSHNAVHTTATENVLPIHTKEEMMGVIAVPCQSTCRALTTPRFSGSVNERAICGSRWRKYRSRARGPLTARRNARMVAHQNRNERRAFQSRQASSGTITIKGVNLIAAARENMSAAVNMRFFR